jgi:hypothetical protein
VCARLAEVLGQGGGGAFPEIGADADAERVHLGLRHRADAVETSDF